MKKHAIYFCDQLFHGLHFACQKWSNIMLLQLQSHCKLVFIWNHWFMLFNMKALLNIASLYIWLVLRGLKCVGYCFIVHHSKTKKFKKNIKILLTYALGYSICHLELSYISTRGSMLVRNVASDWKFNPAQSSKCSRQVTLNILFVNGNVIVDHNLWA